MTTLTSPTTQHSTPPALAELRDRSRGPAYLAADGDYPAAVRAWNLNARHRPAVVVQPERLADVAEAVGWAGRAGLGVGVMATGHGTGRINDDGLLLNTSRLRSVRIDPARRRAVVAAGAVWGDVLMAASRYGLTGVSGSSATVGVVGSTLGGGLGWLGRQHGLGAHSIRRAELVTADGIRRTVGPDEHPDLFWALGGGTGNFGVVTRLELALHPVRALYGGNLYYPHARLRDVFEFFGAWSRRVPVELTAAATIRRFPPSPEVPEPLRGRVLTAIRGAWCGPVEEGRVLLDQARAALGPAELDTFTVMSAGELPGISADPAGPLPVRGHHELLADLTPAVVDVLERLAGPDSDLPLVLVEARQLGGALGGPQGALSPMAHTSARFSVNAVGATPTPEVDSAVVERLDQLAAALGPYATGDTYLNFLDLDRARPDRIRAAFSPSDWTRLQQLKTHYDPGNTFRFNRNLADI